ncbi:PLP-dependent aminotransferase family protein [Mucilaginibacter hurinus]|uniref:PLP-dependent aminotransferase family protein n=1 Tax=Mucilaginibacter hurinus TaxID=2201324 RepID=A0A367GNX2_9SPHI|nr:PLP-dependent aminotransferase family protein [Mucilaginibacter hurinus]RCH55159.1 PLP-dependent aminotransferase family protein [Mucilaginibacter hurinus]
MAVQSLPFRTLIIINRNSGVPVFYQVARAIMGLIRSSKLQPGHQLPSSRQMASILSLNRTTVVASYDELVAEGWLKVKPRKGIFVSDRLPIIKPRPFQANGYSGTSIPEAPTIKHERPFELLINDGFPDQRIAPLNAVMDRYRNLAGKAYLHSPLLTGDWAGSPTLRAELASFLAATRALRIGPENIMVTQGAQMAIFIVASIILKPGSSVIVADLNYALADRLFEQLGARLLKIKVDEHGVDVDAIECICRSGKPDLLYIIPHHHHPTTVTLSVERRLRLLDIIRKYQLPVIEDDYDYDFHYAHSPILPLASAEHEGYVTYIGSISKILAPSFRLGYLVAGESLIRQAAKLKQVIAIRGDVLIEESVGYLFQTGEMQKHIRNSVKLYQKRRDAFCEELRQTISGIGEFLAPQGGMAVWATFDRDYSITLLSERMAAKGIFINEGSRYPYHPDVNGLRLGFASLNDAEMATFFKSWNEVK